MQDEDDLPKPQDPMPDGKEQKGRQGRQGRRTLKGRIRSRVHCALRDRDTPEQPPVRLRTRLILEATRAVSWLSLAVITISLFTPMPQRALGITAGLFILLACFTISMGFITELHLGHQAQTKAQTKAQTEPHARTSARTQPRTRSRRMTT